MIKRIRDYLAYDAPVILAISNLKGGSGKTTAALFLATVMAEQNEAVTVIDACPSGAAMYWADTAEEHGEPLPFRVAPMANPHLGRRVHQLATAGSVIIDSAPANAGIGLAAIEAADLVLIPANARPQDIRQAEAVAVDAARLGKPVVVLMSRVRPQEASMAVCRELLTEAGVSVLDTEVHELTRIGWADGARITDTSPYDQVLAELRSRYPR